jgi:DNA polymerase elongation subunit (family B)
MYRNIYYDQRDQCMKLFTWDTNGNRVIAECSYNPYLYLETRQDTNYKSIFKTNLKKKSFRTPRDRSIFVKSCGLERLFENIVPAQQFLIDTFHTKNEDEDFNKDQLKIFFIDIETYSPGNFPTPEEAPDPINVITIYDSQRGHFISWGTKKLNKNIKNCTYAHCTSEAQMLDCFLNYMQQDWPDILTGWNSEFFDIPYIINRVSKILGDDEHRRLSPVGSVYSTTRPGNFGKQQTRWYIDGVSCIDYLDIYKKFSMGLRESYKLDAIAELELGEKKVDYGNTNLSGLADEDWQTFVEYNIQDVNLLVKMEDKLRYLELLRMLAYTGLTTFESAMGTLSVVTGSCVIKARANKTIIPTFVKDGSGEKYEGAYVGEPQRGFQENIVSFDANSLYPNTMITLNLSPETKIGRILDTTDTHVVIKHVNGKTFNLTHSKFSKFLEDEKIAISRAKILFTQQHKGIVPEFIDGLYKKRVDIKRELGILRRKLSKLKKTDPEYINLKHKADQLDIKQYTIKICLNSAYGYFGNKYAPMGDADIARSITLTGRAVIKQSNKILKKYIFHRAGLSDDSKVDPIIYNDTDSSYISIKSIIENCNIPFVDDNNKITSEVYEELEHLENYLNKEITIWAKKSLNTTDSRFVFKRECICDIGTFLQKKRYVLHVLDDEGIPINKFKYTGVEVVRTTMPGAIKPYVKKIIETMLSTKNKSKTNEVFLETYEIFKDLPLEDYAFVMGIKGYEKYAPQCNGFQICKGMPIHVKASYLYNNLLEKYNIKTKYESISSGDKVRYFYTRTPNKYGIPVLAYKYYFPDEFKEDFQPDIERMFEKIVYQVIERFYDCVNWQLKKPTEQVQTDLFELLGV